MKRQKIGSSSAFAVFRRVRTGIRCSGRGGRYTAVGFLLAALVTGCAWQRQFGCEPVDEKRVGLRIVDPYEEVDWETVGRYRANFHTHTTGSDGNLNPHEVVDRYHALGYRILAITDHNAVTYPWTGFADLAASSTSSNRLAEGKLETDTLEWRNRAPDDLGMIAVQGNELSRHHHIGSLFNDSIGTRDEAESLREVGARNGLAMVYHPGRYSRSIQWYVDLYKQFPFLIGLEVFNQGDRYPGDRATWDAILTALLPERTVWGYSNDDMHRGSHLGRNYSVMLLPELSTEWVRRGLEEGRSYFVYNPTVRDRIASPRLDAIEVDRERLTLRVRATGAHKTTWISEGRVIHRGDRLDLARAPNVGRYVRAELHGKDGVIVCTQPFEIVKPLQIELDIAATPGKVDYAAPGKVKAVARIVNQSDREVKGRAHFRLGKSTLSRNEWTLAPQAEIRVPLVLPAESLNAGQTLEAILGPGSAGGRLQKLKYALPLEVDPPMDATIDWPSRHYAHVGISNRMSAVSLPLTVVGEVNGQERLRESITLPPGGVTTLTCPVTQAADRIALRVRATWTPEISPIQGRFDATFDATNLREIPRRTMPAPDEAPDGPASLALARRDQVLPVGRRDQWSGPEDASLSLHWGWDGKGLWLTAEVTDDRHANPRSGETLWNADALQIAVAPAGAKPTNLAMALTDKGIQTYQWIGKDLELGRKSRIDIRRFDDRNITRYRAWLPLESLGVASESGALLGFNVVVFDNDDLDGYDYWMQYSEGLAGGWAPEKFNRFVLGE